MTTPSDDKGPVWELARPSKIVGARLKQARKTAGVSAPQLAEICAALGMPELTKWRIANIETGRRGTVNVEELFVLARAVGVAPVHLLVGIDDDRDDVGMQVTPVEWMNFRYARMWVIGDWAPAGAADTYWREAPRGWRDRAAQIYDRAQAWAARRVWTAVTAATDDDGTVDADRLEKELSQTFGRRNGNGGR